jgi:geranylgeranyl diphosphate synthase type II
MPKPGSPGKRLTQFLVKCFVEAIGGKQTFPAAYFCRANTFSIQQMQTLHQIQALFEAYIQENRFLKSPENLYSPVNYILQLGGKRFRPAALILSYQLFTGQDIRRALPAAFSIELFHNFTLLHDDIMDAAPLRRGKPTVHTKFGLNAGILSGDVMLVQAYEYLLKSPAEASPANLVQIFNEVATGVCEGQQMDMDFETSLTVTIPDYLKMITLKTSVLVGGAMKIGALIGGSDEENARFMYDFGVNLGIAFQIQDDLLDAFGDPSKFGKKVGGDIVQNKKTYLYLKALEVAGENDKAALLAYFSDTSLEEDDKVNRVLKIYNRLKIKELCSEFIEAYRLKSLAALNKVVTTAERKRGMEDFANNLMKREL